MEGAGLATTQISLVREHTETIVPPRALWVSFPLGRPFGVPEDAGFQTRVLQAALELLDHESGPVLTEFDEDIPEPTAPSSEGWACPIDLPQPTADETDAEANLLREISSLQPWYELSRNRRNRTTVGASGLEPESAATFVAGFLHEVPGSTAGALLIEEAFKLSVEDLKSFYSEAITAQPGNATPEDIQSWLWNETVLGEILLVLHQRFRNGPHAGLAALAEYALVPRAVLEARKLERPSRPRWHTPQQ